MAPTPVSAAEFAERTDLGAWRYVDDALHAEFAAGSFGAGGSLVASIAEAADAVDHHPDIDLRYPGRVQILLTTHSAGGVTTLDLDLARTISALAERSGAGPEPQPEP